MFLSPQSDPAYYVLLSRGVSPDSAARILTGGAVTDTLDRMMVHLFLEHEAECGVTPLPIPQPGSQVGVSPLPIPRPGSQVGVTPLPIPRPGSQVGVTPLPIPQPVWQVGTLPVPLPQAGSLSARDLQLAWFRRLCDGGSA